VCACVLLEPVPVKKSENAFAVQRPHAPVDLLERQGSFRGFEKLSDSSPFKRNISLRLNELPSTLERKGQVIGGGGGIVGPQGSGGIVGPQGTMFSDVTSGKLSILLFSGTGIDFLSINTVQ